MCKHCEAESVLEVEWLPDDVDESCESFDVPDDEGGDDEDDVAFDEDDLEDEDLDWCSEQAQLRLVTRVVQEHLCAEHAKAAEASLAEGLAEFLEEAGLQTDVEFAPVDEADDEVCEECGRPATHAHLVTNEGLFCIAHAVEEGARLPPRP